MAGKTDGTAGEESRRDFLKALGTSAIAATVVPSRAATGEGAYACALQLRVDAVNRDTQRDSARARMRASLTRVESQLRGARSWIGPDLKLVVLPEYFLTGFPTSESVPQWLDKAVLDIEGPEYTELARIAQSNAVYLAGNAYERDPAFPDIFFQCSFVLDPAGRRVLGYRRLVSTLVPTPHDVWDAYLDRYGLEAVFPVARTPIGNLAAVASEEILYPELARAHMARGAEVLLHSSSEAYTTTLPPKRIARLARAVENLAWVVSANSAGVDNIDIALDSANGGSEIIDHLGRIVVSTGQGESMTAHAMLDIAELRAYRRRSGINNVLARQPFDLYVAAYAGGTTAFRQKNGLLRDGKVVVPERAWFRDRQRQTLDRLVAKGIVG